jgi:hypothetical protein
MSSAQQGNLSPPPPYSAVASGGIIQPTPVYFPLNELIKFYTLMLVTVGVLLTTIHEVSRYNASSTLLVSATMTSAQHVHKWDPHNAGWICFLLGLTTIATYGAIQLLRFVVDYAWRTVKGITVALLWLCLFILIVAAILCFQSMRQTPVAFSNAWENVSQLTQNQTSFVDSIAYYAPFLSKHLRSEL